jgi:TfoX/Sxy family transcriptional regulator of competence genes
MSCDPDFVAYLCDQMRGAGRIESRKMFGEYAIYCDGRVVVLACDNQCFLKPTAGARAALAAPVEAPPYPGAKAHFLLTDELDDRELMTRLVRLVAAEVPLPKPKKTKAVKAAGTRRQ